MAVPSGKRVGLFMVIALFAFSTGLVQAETTVNIVKDINPGAPGSNLLHLTDVGGTLFFSANVGTNGLEVWKSTGTKKSTKLVKDIWPGGANSSSSR